MAISKRLRYEVLKRDGYRCRYCGASAPDAVITIDHVVPQALGGGDEPSNLVAACKDCNGGKTSVSPDAPLVADVADDALRWSRAITVAAGEMLASASEGVDAIAHFEKAWGRYGTGPRRKPLPKDPGWQNTVTTLLSAGLPMGVLEECIEIAMSQRKVPENNVFRYMCGVAWRKVRELRDRAKELASSDPTPAINADPYQQGRVDFARELLNELTEDERQGLREAIDDSAWCEANGEPIPTEDDITLQTASYAQGFYRDQMLHLQEVALKEFRAYPDGVGERAMRHARTVLYEHWGPDFDKGMFLTQALRALDDELRYPAAEQYLANLPNEESAEWLAVALALNESRYLSERGVCVLAARCAQEGITKRRDAQKLCCGTGQHIPVCSQQGTYRARIAGLRCCEDPDHKGHLVCERHLEMLMDGTFLSPNGSGRTFSACDFTELEPEPVPF